MADGPIGPTLDGVLDHQRQLVVAALDIRHTMLTLDHRLERVERALLRLQKLLEELPILIHQQEQADSAHAEGTRRLQQLQEILKAAATPEAEEPALAWTRP